MVLCQLFVYILVFLASMALVASPTSVWRDPNVMSTSAVSNLEQPSLLPLHPVTSTEGGVYQFMGVPAHPKRENPTPTPPHMGSSDSESTIKDENGQDITCVVCGDKSSGKHYAFRSLLYVKYQDAPNTTGVTAGEGLLVGLFDQKPQFWAIWSS